MRPIATSMSIPRRNLRTSDSGEVVTAVISELLPNVSFLNDVLLFMTLCLMVGFSVLW